MRRLLLPARLLAETFDHFRTCGRGRRECQVLWTGPWAAPDTITAAVHSGHRAHAGGFHVDDAWLNSFWIGLAERRDGVRVQVHTHPHEAFHSPTDDAFPIVQSPGFLSLVIPDFGMGAASFGNAYLCEITETGAWQRVDIATHIAVMP
jgi:hypothetical protein